MYRMDFWVLWEKARVGCFERTASKHVYYLGWNRSPAQVGCMRQVLGPGALGGPRGSGWRGRWEGDSGWGTHVNPWLIHVNVWQKPLQYCKVISLQLIKINGKIKNKKSLCWFCYNFAFVLWFGFFSLKAYRILVSQPGIVPATPALEGEVPAIGLPGKSPLLFENLTTEITASWD